MEWYNILEADYKKPLLENQEKLLLEEQKNTDALKALLETDPILKALKEAPKEEFYKFAICCNRLAAHSGGEISVAIHPTENQASVVIVTALLQTASVIKSYLETAIRYSVHFAAEPVEENGLKLMLYFNHPLV